MVFTRRRSILHTTHLRQRSQLRLSNLQHQAVRCCGTIRRPIAQIDLRQHLRRLRPSEYETDLRPWDPLVHGLKTVQCRLPRLRMLVVEVEVAEIRLQQAEEAASAIC